MFLALGLSRLPIDISSFFLAWHGVACCLSSVASRISSGLLCGCRFVHDDVLLLSLVKPASAASGGDGDDGNDGSPLIVSCLGIFEKEPRGSVRGPAGGPGGGRSSVRVRRTHVDLFFSFFGRVGGRRGSESGVAVVVVAVVIWQ